MTSSRVFRVALVVALSVVLTFLTLPVVAIFVNTSRSTWSRAWGRRARSTRCA
jgi:ABC-type sulfate transport system permease component